jgi:hypothetical protein
VNQAPNPQTFGLIGGDLKTDLVMDVSIQDDEEGALIEQGLDEFGGPPQKKRNGCVSIICCICCCDTSGFGSKGSLDHLSD